MSTQEQEVNQMTRRLRNFHCRVDLRKNNEELEKRGSWWVLSYNNKNVMRISVTWWNSLTISGDDVGAVVVEKVPGSSVKFSVCELWEKSFPECAFSDSVTLQDLAGGGAEGEGFSLERSVQRPVGVSPGLVTGQWGVTEISRLYLLYTHSVTL